MGIYNKMEQFFINNELFDQEMYEQYILKRLDEEDLFNIIGTINISDNTVCGFNGVTSTLSFNRYEIFYFSQKQLKNSIFKYEDIKNKIIKNPNELNYFNLFEINHELEHAKQLSTLLYPVESNNLFYFWYRQMLFKDQFTSYHDDEYLNSELYINFHDNFFSEYSADIESELETIALINSFNNKELNKLLYKINKVTAKRLLELYTDIDDEDKYSTPLNNALKLYKAMLKIIKNNDYPHFPTAPLSELRKIDRPNDTIDRLRLGLALNSKTMNHINNVANGKDKTLNLYNDIRNL